ncbi:MAG: porphobilinogen synthase [Candidatus Omnitrophica bacterium]|nr:porphobilinogen synthase [Candidatus Omnitrophota bacterium]
MEGRYPETRLRRLRKNDNLRRLVRETRISLDQLVMPYFVRDGRNIREPIDSMPGQFRYSPDVLLEELQVLEEAGVRAVLLFGIPEAKDSSAFGAWDADGIIQKTCREIKKRFQDLLVMTDVCLCAYTEHGHCGVLDTNGCVDNDMTLQILQKTALSHAEAGSDIVAPSGMMDGVVHTIRQCLDQNQFHDTPIMSYSAKYASSFYGPFRDAAHSAPAFGDRKTYQMDPANIKEAMREIALDIAEGADIVMIKPGLPYLDVIREASTTYPVPVAAYAVSGEYSMVKAAAEKGYLDERKVMFEMMTSLARAGAQIFITYFAKNIALSKDTPEAAQVLALH